MLKHLYIKNYTLIDQLDVELYDGFSVITGETGAGKSIILGAIGLLLGQRADAKSLKQGADKCIVEAHFDLSRYDLREFFEQNDLEYEAADCIIRRELTRNTDGLAKSRAFINDTPAALTMLKELGERLVDIHSQHQNLLLQKHDFQMSVVDTIADDGQELNAYRTRYDKYLETKQKLARMKEELEQSQRNADFLQFQYDELTNAQLTAGEQEELEQRSDTMSHAEDIKTALYEADQALNAEQTGIVTQQRTATNALKSIVRVLPAAAELAERMESVHIELKDIAHEAGRLMENIDFDPAELDAVNLRLDKLYDLQKKYQADTVEALIAKRDELGQMLQNLENSDEAINELEQQAAHELEDCQREADKLTKVRSKAAHQIEQQMRERLVPLGIPNVRFNVSLERGTLNRAGQDTVCFLFSANTSTPPQPVSQVASGGEIARVMLSLKAMISGVVKLPTIIFDEIDTGVSGKTAEKMADIMREMGQNGRQVISITHLPQIAAMGSTHYRVSKEETAAGTVSSMRQLSDHERVSEIAQMVSGSNVTEAAVENARQLLKHE